MRFFPKINEGHQPCNLHFLFIIVREDELTFYFQSFGKINANGIAYPPKNQKNFDQSLLKIDQSAVETLSIFNQIISLQGRCQSLPLDIDFSMHELACSLHEIGKEAFKSSRVIFDGGRVWRVIRPVVYRVWIGGVVIYLRLLRYAYVTHSSNIDFMSFLFTFFKIISMIRVFSRT